MDLAITPATSTPNMRWMPLRIARHAACRLLCVASVLYVMSAAIGIKAAAAVRLAPENNYPPFSFIENDRWQGLSADMIQQMQAYLPERLQILPGNDLAHILEGAQAGQVDVITSLKETPERSRFLLFTQPYVQVPTAILVRTSSTPGAWPQSFIGKRVAVGKGYGVESYLAQHYPKISLNPVSDDLEGLRQLSFGSVDAVVMDMASASYFIEREKFTNLRVFSGFEYTYDLRFAIRKDMPEVQTQLQAALSAMSDAEKNAVVHKWITVGIDPWDTLHDAWQRIRPWLLGAAAALVAIGIMGWNARNRRRKLERAAATYARGLLESSLDPLVTINVDGTITDVNSATEKATGESRHVLIGSDFANYFTNPERARSAYRLAFEHGFVTNYPLAIRNQNGDVTEVMYNANVYRDEDGVIQGVFAAARDVTERNKAESLVQAASVFSHSREGILICDASQRVVNVNRAFQRITGFAPDQVLGQIPSLLKSDLQSPAFYAELQAELVAKAQWHGELWDRRHNGELFKAALTVTTVPDDQGKTSHYVLLFSDITAIWQHQEQLEKLAHFDTLTQLPNRLLLSDRLRQGIAFAERRGRTLAVAYLDLDGFKSVNDLYGHTTGDRLLMKLAERINDTLREGDTFARLGGDEFVAVLTDLENTEAAVPILERLLEMAATPVEIDQLSLQVSASVGVSYFPQCASTDAEQLLRQADHAMYQAKLSGKNRYAVFDAENDVSVRDQNANLERIRQGLDANEFVLHYQPKVNMRTRALVGVEALIRWQHPEQGVLLPGVFLPQLENHVMSIDIGDWVIRQALIQLTEWEKTGHMVPISVNISTMQLQQADFFVRLQRMLADCPALPPYSLQLEILETSAFSDLDHVSAFIEQCEALGVSLAIDDFGTGYSSLNYLKRLPVSTVKIDQSFIQAMLEDTASRTILEGVLWIMRALQRSVVAEGVETLAHGSALIALGCDVAQGYAIGRPMPAHELPAWLAQWQTHQAWQDVAKRAPVKSRCEPHS